MLQLNSALSSSCTQSSTIWYPQSYVTKTSELRYHHYRNSVTKEPEFAQIIRIQDFRLSCCDKNTPVRSLGPENASKNALLNHKAAIWGDKGEYGAHKCIFVAATRVEILIQHSGESWSLIPSRRECAEPSNTEERYSRACARICFYPALC